MPGSAKAKGVKSGSSVNASIAEAAKDAASSGRPKESLMFNEKLYRSDPRNNDYILAYARDLRRAGRIDDALLVVRTPAKNKKATSPILTECAMVLISDGKYDEAMGFAQKALQKDGKSPDAHQALALAMSGMGEHEDAELQFKKALDLWPEKRDRTPIINNLAMSMAAQGKITQARDVMSQATGEALTSETYQTNRALLESLKDRPQAEKLDPKKPIAIDIRKTKARMKPIIE